MPSGALGPKVVKVSEATLTYVAIDRDAGPPGTAQLDCCSDAPTLAAVGALGPRRPR